MVLVMALGVWLVVGTGQRLTGYPDLRDGATTHDLRVGPMRGLLEVVDPPDEPPTFRVLRRDASASGVLTAEDVREWVGTEELNAITSREPHLLFRVFNITSWWGFAWVAIGLLGQVAFFGRMAIQWIVSERTRASVVPPAFWYLSFAGGVCLFTYFVWRQDVVGVLGQTTGVVIYARNIRLILKQRARDRRRAARADALGNVDAD